MGEAWSEMGILQTLLEKASSLFSLASAKGEANHRASQRWRGGVYSIKKTDGKRNKI